MNERDLSPGELVWARGREWVVISGGETLLLRPLTGSEEDVERIIPALEYEPVAHARFDPPDFQRNGGRDAALLLRDAMRLSLRRGAGPFRGAGRINFEPRAYQLAPLVMALRQETVRLLIADDVGVGKTVEAGLIVREMIERGAIDRFTVLCPPHLIDQWVEELDQKFAIGATAVTASDAAKLERDLIGAQSVFEAHPYTVVSLDFIKSVRRIDDFERACPNLVIVDEAHTAVSGDGARHQRHMLLRRLSEKSDRHIVLLTATPHSGDDAAFHALLGLLRPEFGALDDVGPDERRRLRERLAGHFIQRRRADIEAWREPGLFPERETTEVTYTLGGAHERLFNGVLDYCVDVVEAEEGERRQRLAFWGMLALMRCIGSSPAAALRALRSRAAADPLEAEIDALAASALDEEEDTTDDLEPSVAIEDPRLAALVEQAERLAAKAATDPKFAELLKVVRALAADGYSPVVFCRFIATAKAVGEALQTAMKAHRVEVVTGELVSEDRADRVEALGAEEARILVATDCLSEGINLQDAFDAVIHYDLSWNPTRHQQRDGRVDRFGQKRPTVRSVLIYGSNNPVDGAVLDVILRKARIIERQTGVRVPMPDEGGSLTRALMSAVFLRARERKQFSFDFSVTDTEAAKAIDFAWRNASEAESRARTIFAQNTLKLEDVAPEWEATRKALGDFADVERFTTRALTRLGARPSEVGGGLAAPLHLTPGAVRERLEAEGLVDRRDRAVRIAFEARPRAGFLSIHRAHPLPAVLAETFLERALDAASDVTDPATLPRCGVWETPGVAFATLLLLLRLRHRIDSRGRLATKFALAEEATALALKLSTLERQADGDGAFALLETESASVADVARDRQLDRVREALPKLETTLEGYAKERAAALADDHTRFRRALGSEAATRVTAVLPVDIVGAYVLLPRI